MFNIASAAAIDKQENDSAGRRIAGCVLARLENKRDHDYNSNSHLDFHARKVSHAKAS
jgi:hypothetical protein